VGVDCAVISPLERSKSSLAPPDLENGSPKAGVVWKEWQGWFLKVKRGTRSRLPRFPVSRAQRELAGKKVGEKPRKTFPPQKQGVLAKKYEGSNWVHVKRGTGG